MACACWAREGREDWYWRESPLIKSTSEREVGVGDGMVRVGDWYSIYLVSFLDEKTFLNEMNDTG